ncbi:MAG: hypothetical protein KDB63_01010 [Nocardioidaceae bacterium]|nr:hypothetical protein [Nocardioidaceae bacterium]
MDTIRLVLSAAWNVLWVGLLLGAGLPTLFAAGVRLLAGPADTVTADGIAVQHDAPGWHKLLAWLCFAIVLYGVLVGILIIVGGGMGKVVEFHGVLPTLVPKH